MKNNDLEPVNGDLRARLEKVAEFVGRVDCRMAQELRQIRLEVCRLEAREHSFRMQMYEVHKFPDIADPAKHFTAVDMQNAAKDGYRDGFATAIKSLPGQQRFTNWAAYTDWRREQIKAVGDAGGVAQ